MQRKPKKKPFGGFSIDPSLGGLLNGIDLNNLDFSQVAQLGSQIGGDPFNQAMTFDDPSMYTDSIVGMGSGQYAAANNPLRTPEEIEEEAKKRTFLGIGKGHARRKLRLENEARERDNMATAGQNTNSALEQFQSMSGLFDLIGNFQKGGKLQNGGKYTVTDSNANTMDQRKPNYGNNPLSAMAHQLLPNDEGELAYYGRNGDGLTPEELLSNIPYLMQHRKEQLKELETSDDVGAITKEALYSRYLGLDENVLSKYKGELPPSLKGTKEAVYSLPKQYEKTLYNDIIKSYNQNKEYGYKMEKRSDGFYKVPSEHMNNYELAEFGAWYNPDTKEVRYYDRYDLDKIPLADKVVGKPYTLYGRIKAEDVEQKALGGKSALGYSDNSPYKNEPSITIDSNNITMANTGRPLLAIPDIGRPKFLKPYSGNHYFPNATKVKEIPVMQDGGAVDFHTKAAAFATATDKNGAWEYSKTLPPEQRDAFFKAYNDTATKLVSQAISHGVGSGELKRGEDHTGYYAKFLIDPRDFSYAEYEAQKVAAVPLTGGVAQAATFQGNVKAKGGPSNFQQGGYIPLPPGGYRGADGNPYDSDGNRLGVAFNNGNPIYVPRGGKDPNKAVEQERANVVEYVESPEYRERLGNFPKTYPDPSATQARNAGRVKSAKVGVEDMPTANGQPVHGYYDPNTHKAVVDNDPKAVENTVRHELGHASRKGVISSAESSYINKKFNKDSDVGRNYPPEEWASEYHARMTAIKANPSVGYGNKTPEEMKAMVEGQGNDPAIYDLYEMTAGNTPEEKYKNMAEAWNTIAATASADPNTATTAKYGGKPTQYHSGGHGNDADMFSKFIQYLNSTYAQDPTVSNVEMPSSSGYSIADLSQTPLLPTLTPEDQQFFRDVLDKSKSKKESKTAKKEETVPPNFEEYPNPIDAAPKKEYALDKLPRLPVKDIVAKRPLPDIDTDNGVIAGGELTQDWKGVPNIKVVSKKNRNGKYVPMFLENAEGKRIEYLNYKDKSLPRGFQYPEQLMFGGKKKEKKKIPYYQEGGQPVPQGVQLEEDEVILTPNMDILDTAARKSHQKMDSKTVTDIMRPEDYVLSNRLKIKKSEAEKMSLGFGAMLYREGQIPKMPEEQTIASIFKDGEKELTLAEYGKRVRKKLPITDKDDPFSLKTNDANRAARLPYLAAAVYKNEMKRTKGKPEYQFESAFENPFETSFGSKSGATDEGMSVMGGIGSVPQQKQAGGPLDALGAVAGIGNFFTGMLDTAFYAPKRAKMAQAAIEADRKAIGTLAETQSGFSNAATAAALAGYSLQDPTVNAPQYDSTQLDARVRRVPRTLFDYASGRAMAGSRSFQDSLFKNAGSFGQAANAYAPIHAQNIGLLGNLGMQEVQQNIGLENQYRGMKQGFNDRQTLADTTARNATRTNQNALTAGTASTISGGISSQGTIETNRQNALRQNALQKSQSQINANSLIQQGTQQAFNNLYMGASSLPDGLFQRPVQPVNNNIPPSIYQLPSNAPPLPGLTTPPPSPYIGGLPPYQDAYGNWIFG